MIGYDFITAGKATFTLQGKDARFTYRVSRKDAEPGSRYGNQPTFFVGLLSGPDNQADYRYLGILDPATGFVRLTRNSKMSASAPAVKAIQWALPKLHAGAAMPPSFSIHHEGHCGRCGRALTVPESIETGIGPECASKMGIAQVTKAEAQAKAQARNAVAVVREQYRERHDTTIYGLASGRYEGLDPFKGGEDTDGTEDYNLFAEKFEEAR